MHLYALIMRWDDARSKAAMPRVGEQSNGELMARTDGDVRPPGTGRRFLAWGLQARSHDARARRQGDVLLRHSH
jgi:hypothetical protein